MPVFDNGDYVLYDFNTSMDNTLVHACVINCLFFIHACIISFAITSSMRVLYQLQLLDPCLYYIN